MRRKVLKTITPLLAAALLAAPGSALGALGGVSFYGGNGTLGGEFRGPDAMAVSEAGAGGASPGDLYVVDRSNNRIQQLSSSGKFIRAFGLGVGGPGVNVCTEAASCVAGEASAEAGALTGVDDITVDQATGAIYVTGNTNHRVDVFSATGEFEGAFGWAVKATGSAEELQFCTTATGCKAGSLGSGAGQFSSTGDRRDRVAVSPLNGHILIADAGSQRIDEFAPTIEAGKVIGVSFVRGYGWGAATGANEFQICTAVCHVPPLVVGGGTEPGFFNLGYPGAIDVDASGRVYAYDRGEKNFSSFPRIQTFDPEGNFVEFFAQGESLSGTRDLEIDLSNGHVLAGNRFAISEFDSAGTNLGTIFSVKADSLFGGLAKDEGAGTIYLSIDGPGVNPKTEVLEGPESGVVKLGEGSLPTASVEPVVTFTGTTAHFEGHVNPQGLFTRYNFEYSSDGGKTWTKLPGGNLPADSSEHAVSADAGGLEGLTQYQVRLTATKLYNAVGAGAETTFKTGEAPPVAGPTSTAAVTSSSARLEATINPHNQATGYHFECVSEAQFEADGYTNATEVPMGGATLEAVGQAVPVSQQITGLDASTSYRCRLSASNQAGAHTGAEWAFTTYELASFGLPDGRVFEQATPLDKNGADANGIEFLLRAAPDGSAVSYFISGGGGESNGGGQEFPTYLAARTGGDWKSHAFLPGSRVGERARVSGWSEDMKRDYVLVWDSGTTATFYEHDLAGGQLREIVGGLDAYTGALYAGETPGGAQVLFESKSALAPEAIEGVWNLYLWERASGALNLVSVLPDESSPPGGAFAGAYHWGGLDPKSGGSNGDEYTQDLHVLSDDGTKAFFTTSNVNQLYVRKGIGTQSPSTAQVSASQRTPKDPKGTKKAAFMGATPDGRYVFFTSQEKLTDDATTGPTSQGNDLYRYDTVSGQLIDIAVDTTDANGAEVQAVLDYSEDGSHVYFAANGMLDDGASAGDCKSSAVTGWGSMGICNLYLWHDGEITFISRIGSDPGGGSLNWIPGNYIGLRLPIRTARASADGKSLVFASTLSLTAYDSAGKGEFYRYDTEEGLDCLSCNPTFAPPVGSATQQSLEPGFTRPSLPAPFFLHSFSADGNRFFFETADKLVAGDTNGDNGCPVVRPGGLIRSCQDVYEWEANGTGSCESEAQNGGCLYLISTGESNEPSYFADASSNGDDAFFFTRQSLVRQDGDQLYDVYDARVGGGIPSQNEAPPTRCEGEACRLGAATPPPSQSAGSAGFSGPPNATPNRKKSKKKHAKKRHGKKHAKKAKKHTKKAKKSRTHR